MILSKMSRANTSLLKTLKLSYEESDKIEGKLAIEKCLKALKSMTNRASLGEDGFTVKFYT